MGRPQQIALIKSLLMQKLLLLLVVFASCNLFAQTTTSAVTIIVAKDGSGNFKTIQEAVNSIRDLGMARVKIFVRNGVYKEKLVIPSWKTNITISGESKEKTIITNDDHTGKPYPGKDPSGSVQYMTFTSYTVLIEGNDFIAENLTIQNTAGRVGQAVALHVEADRVIIRNCNLSGNQDTLYAAKENSRQYYVDCHIEGTTDFIFGEATAVFRRCTIKSLANSYITAAATRQGQRFGFVFLNCKLVADSGVNKVFLGRPWRPYAKTVFIQSELGSHIVAAGWDPWKGDAMFPDKEKTAFYAEYSNTGAGSTVKGRVPWAKQLTRKKVKDYTIKNIFSGWSINDL